MAEIAFVQQEIPQYRIAYFNAISEVSGHDIVVVADEPETPNGAKFEVRRARVFGRPDRFVLQPSVPAAVRNSACVVAALSGRDLTAHLLSQRRSRESLVFWGHGMSRNQLDLAEDTKVRNGFAVSKTARSRLLKRSRAIATYTNAGGEAIKQMHPALDLLIWPIGNGLYERDQIRTLDGPRTNVVVSGRLIPSKRVDLAIDAFAHARGSLGDKSRLIVVGDGPEKGRLEARAGDLGVADSVSFLGAVWDVAKLRSVYDGAFCHLSPGYVGLSGIQAAGWGVRTVTSGLEPHAPEIHIVSDVGALVLTDTSTAQDLAAGLVTAKNAEERDPEAKHAVTEAVAATCSLEAVAQRWADLFQRVIQ